MDVYSHMFLARHLEGGFGAAFGGRFGAEFKPYWPYFCAGCIAPDVANFYQPALTYAAFWHHMRCADFCRALFALSQKPEEYAFSLGWLAHFLLDIESHPNFIEPLAEQSLRAEGLDLTLASPRKRLEFHMRLEYGHSCGLLSEEENGWLWRVSEHIALPADLYSTDGFFNQAFARTYGRSMPVKFIRRQWRRAIFFLQLLPGVFQAMGAARRPSAVSGHPLILRASVRTFYRPLRYLCRTFDLWYDAQVVLAPLELDAAAQTLHRNYLQQQLPRLIDGLRGAGRDLPNVSMDNGLFPWQGAPEKVLRVTRDYSQAGALRFFKRHFPGEAEELYRALDDFMQQSLQDSPSATCPAPVTQKVPGTGARHRS